ncbi:MAG: ABC transporter substrate-binding protein [Thalassospira sp.]|uniref:ABC transporter substrate-binding protein n=1 Tax=Thalassospira sp. TaxID=1912094 RepID=UPI0032ED35E1
MEMLKRPFSGCITIIAATLVLLAGNPAQAERFELGAAPSEADAVVGCLYPMTGRSATYGRDSIAGIQIALDDLAAEAASGLPAPKLRVIADDPRSKASYAVRLAQDFIANDKARFFCGIVSSGVAHAVSDLALREKIIMVGTDHASSRLSIEAGHKYYFRVTNDSWTSMAAGARYLRDLQKETGWKKLAFIGPDYDYGHVSWTDLQLALDELDVEYETVSDLWPKLYEPDYSIYINALQSAKPDIVVTALWGGDFIAFIKQASTTRFFETTRLANFDTGANYDVMMALGDQPYPGLILSARHHNNWPETGRNKRFVTQFHEMTGRYPTYAAEGAYTGIMAIARAIEKAGTADDDAALIKALEGLQLALPEDPPGFASYIDPDTHQIVQAQAVGTVVHNEDFPPSKLMVGNWAIYDAEDLKPSQEMVKRRRDAVAGGSEAVPPPTP